MDQDIEKTAAEALEELKNADTGASETSAPAETPPASPKEGGQHKTPPEGKKKKKKKKYKLQAMDIITIIFTAVIVGIMAYVLYTQFSGKAGGGSATASPTKSSETPAPATPTAKPVLSDIGNVYGNITNGADVAVIDKREYFISADAEGKKHIYVTAGETTAELIQTDASSLNVVTDFIAYPEESDQTAYYVFYINGSGNICYVYNGPVGEGVSDEQKSLEEKVFSEGKYQQIDVSGDNVFYLDAAGQIGKISISEKVKTLLSEDRAYRSFCVYYGVIYAIGKEDNLLYSIPSTPATDATSTAAPSATPTAVATGTAGETKRETVLINVACEKFVIDSDWIYIINDSGITRYLIDGSGKDTLSAAKADAINVYKEKIYYLAGGELYAGSPSDLLLNQAVQIGPAPGGSLNVAANTIYLKNEQGKILKCSYDSKAGTYGALSEMK